MRFDLPAQLKLVHTMIIPMRWGDMDAMGHLNNATYFRYFETVRIDWLAPQGAGPNPTGTGPVMANAFCNFTKQIEFPANVVAKHFVGQAGRSSIETFFTLEREDLLGVVHAAGGSTLVWVDFKAQKPVALPDWLRAMCD
jgi:acyl-CoA thioester hydrolase